MMSQCLLLATLLQKLIMVITTEVHTPAYMPNFVTTAIQTMRDKELMAQQETKGS